MTSVRRRVPALLLAALVAASCGDTPPSASPSSPASAAPSAAALATERPFAPAAWPEAASACGTKGYGGLLGRIEATAARTVRFTLCAPDGAFPARLAHPSLGILDTVVAERVGKDPGAIRDVSGAGTFRVAAWSPGTIELERVEDAARQAPSAGAASPAGSAAPAGPVPTIVIRWDPGASARLAALQGAEVDGIDDPPAADLDTISTIPELAILPRPGLSTAYLGFGTGFQLNKASVRRAFAQGVDRDALAEDTLRAGALAADYLAPCEVLGGCNGTAWYDFNGPQGSAALDDAGFDRRPAIPLHVPDAPLPGVADPAALGRAVAAQLVDSLGVKIKVAAMPAADLARAVAAKRIDGLYLASVASPLADASGYLGRLFGRSATSLTAARAPGVTAALADAAAVTDPAERATALGKANDQLRAAVPLVPLVHPGSVTVWRADVTGAAVSPMGADPLGSFVPGDRSQVVAMGTAEPDGAWCGTTTALDALRLCALVTPGLYAFDGASLRPVPALASACTPSEGARVWTCRLRAGRFADGAQVDAADVVGSLRLVADAGSPLRASLPSDAFAAWDGLFGAPLPAP